MPATTRAKGDKNTIHITRTIDGRTVKGHAEYEPIVDGWFCAVGTDRRGPVNDPWIELRDMIELEIYTPSND